MDRHEDPLIDTDVWCSQFGEGGVPEGLGKTDRTIFEGPAVVQVLKVANVTEPSYSQHMQAGRCRALMITLTVRRRTSAAEY